MRSARCGFRVMRAPPDRSWVDNGPARRWSRPLRNAAAQRQNVMRTKPTYVIDGRNFTTLEAFYDEISRVLIPQRDWGRNLDAFSDILRGGFGTSDGGFILEWRNSELSRQRLSHFETVRLKRPLHALS